MITPQANLIHTNRKLGNAGIPMQQGTSRVIYDDLPYVDTSLVYRFFETASAKQFPRTNLSGRGNQLEPGETMVVQRMYFSFIEYLTADHDSIAGVFSAEGINDPGYLMGEWNFEIANQQVIKPVPVGGTQSPFEIDNLLDENSNFRLDTDIIIPPMLEFVLTLRLPQAPIYASGDNMFIRCAFEGVGSLLNLRQTL